MSDKIPETDEEEEVEVVATVQQAVSYFTSNNNKVSSGLGILEGALWLNLLSPLIHSLTAPSILWSEKEKIMFYLQRWTSG